MKFLLVLVWIVLVTLGMGYTLQQVTTIPDVEFSVTQDRCVKVVEYGSMNSKKGFTCENLPEKYTKIWVK